MKSDKRSIIKIFYNYKKERECEQLGMEFRLQMRFKQFRRRRLLEIKKWKEKTM